MATKEIYSCNLCGTEYDKYKETLENIIGLNFSGMRKFKLDAPNTTKGYHVCKFCVAQIVEQAPPILKSMGVVTPTENQ